MVAFIGHSNDLQGWVRALKAAGYNHLWAHMDSYEEAYYAASLRSLMDAAQVIGGVQVSPGIAGGMPVASVVRVFTDTWNHPALLRLDGKRVYMSYGHDAARFAGAVPPLSAAGMPRSGFLLLANTLFPAPNGSGGWSERVTSVASTEAQVNHAYDIDPNIDGLINFAVDKGSSNPATFIARVVGENSTTTTVGRGRGKVTAAGTSAIYASVQYTDLGFAGAASMWQAILGGAAKPEFVIDTTANDYVELSYTAPLENPDTYGGAYVPLSSAGYLLPGTVRAPLPDHSGVQKFLRPWADAYLSGQSQPSFPVDRMFAWYYLHPLNSRPMTGMPAALAALSPKFTQDWWSSSLYATASNRVGGMNQIAGIQSNFAQQAGVIRMAAHLVAPAQLKINDTLSATLPAGPAYFEIPATPGTPTFSIVRGGKPVLTGRGRQPITGDVFPGGWNPLITEVP